MPSLKKDPRLWQVGFLSLLLVFGIAARDFTIPPLTIATVLGAAWTAQLVAILLLKVPKSSLLSASITGVSLLLLARANHPAVLAVAVIVAVASKFLLRARGKHFFNPTNFAIAVGLLTGDHLWISPAQWGEGTLLAFWLLGAGLFVARRSARNDVSLGFLGVYVGLLAGRVAYLGQPLAVLEHQLTSGSLLLFTFFMISDPRSTPDHRFSRLIFGALVAIVAYGLRFRAYHPGALFLALLFVAPLTPVLDAMWKASRFEWLSAWEDPWPRTTSPRRLAEASS